MIIFQVFEELGGMNLTTGSSHSDVKNSMYRPSQADILYLVHQCRVTEENIVSVLLDLT